MTKSQISNAIDTLAVKVEAFVGETELTIGALEKLSPGETVRLNTALNETVEMRVNGVLIGKGELVAVDDSFAVRITELSASTTQS